MFDEFVANATPAGTETHPFDIDEYRASVDGRSRLDGIEAFLASRHLSLPRGHPEDPPEAATVWGLANRKIQCILDALESDPPRAFADALPLMDALDSAAVAMAVVTASRNRRAILTAAGMTNLFPVTVDGIDAERLGLAGKPRPDLFVEAARRLAVDPARAVVVEDALAGVAAATRGDFGLIVAVDRTGRPGDFRRAGAHVVVDDLSQVRIEDRPTGAGTQDTPSAGGGTEWRIECVGFAPADEGRREAIFALGNGVFGSRCAAPEAETDPVHYPGTYAAGLFNRLPSSVGGRTVEHESMVNVPNWLPLSFRAVEGEWIDLSTWDLSWYRQHLDLRRGVSYRHITVTDPGGRTTRVSERRLVHMDAPHLVAIEWTIVPVNWSGNLDVRSGVDGTVENRNVTAERQLAGRHLTEVSTGTEGDDIMWVDARTSQSLRHLTVAARTRLLVDGTTAAPSSHVVDAVDRIEQQVAIMATQGSTVTVEKIPAIVTTLDAAIADPRSAAIDLLGDAGSMHQLVAAHSDAWERLWRLARLELGNHEPELSRTLNLHTFHLLQTLSPHIVDRDVGVPARGLTGEGYRGHVFWDELFVFPYLNLRFPALARELLLYRHRRLGAARRQAAALGCRGARFPWQSGSDGREETPTEFLNPRSGRWMPDNSRRQHHVGLAVAYELWQYHQVTGDDDFLVSHGAELLVEIARFWVDLAVLDPTTGRYSIRGVMGPDEFHDGYPDRPGQGIDDNAYTNVMVSWLLQRTVETHRLLGEQAGDLWQKLHLGVDEVDTWDHVSRHLHVGFHGEGIISQFAAYDDLAELDWDAYRDRYGNIGRLDLILEAEDVSTNRYKAAKQADVLMLFYLFSAEELASLFAHLGYDFDPRRIPDIVDYYTNRMTHGSTLCRVAMAWVLARTDRSRSWNIFREALSSDVADIQGGTTREGIHLGAMAGTIDLVQRCYTGLEIRDDALWFNPRLPIEVDKLHFTFRYRNHDIDATVSTERIDLLATPTAGTRELIPVRVRAGGRDFTLPQDERVTIDLALNPRAAPVPAEPQGG